MDPFDDILPAAPAARGRVGGRFAPKAKSKLLPRNISASEHETSSKDGKNEHVASSSTNKDPKEISQNECHDAALVDAQASTITVSEAELDSNFTNLDKSTCEKDRVASEVDLDTNFIPETNLSNGSTQPVRPANAVENILSNVAVPPTTFSTIGSMEEAPKIGKGSFLDKSLPVDSGVGFKSASDSSVAIFENGHSNFTFGRDHEAESAEFEFDSFSIVLPDPGTRTARKFQPKIKPRPRVGTKPAIASASSSVMMGKSVELPTSCSNEVQSYQSSDNGSGGLKQSTDLPITTSQIPMTTDLSSNGTSFGKSSGENADIFSGLESLDDSLAQGTTDTGKPARQKGTEGNFVIPACSSMDSFGVSDTTQVERFPEHHTTQDSSTLVEAAVLNEDDTHANNRRLETEEVVDLSAACPVNDVLDYQSKSGNDPTCEIPVHEELTKVTDSPTLADLLQADDIGEKEDANVTKKDGTKLSSLRKGRRSSIASAEDIGVKTSRKLRKQAAHKAVNNSVNEEDDDLDPPYNPNRDELEENDDEFDVDYSSKKTKSTSSTKKSGAKNGKTSQKRKKADMDLENATKEPPKKFSHSTRRKKRCVDKALLEIPEDELDMSTLPIKDIILLAEYRERLAKKDATTSNTSSNQSGTDSLHEAGANSEEEDLGSENDREPGDDQASENIPLAASLFNYQSFMDKPPRGKWSKQDTELFYEAVRQFGTDFSMIQQLFPDRTRHQIKLKYKKEERQHPLELADAVNNRAKDHTHFKLVIERLQQASTKADQDLGIDGSNFMTGEEVEDLTPEANDEVATTEKEEVAPTEQEANVKEDQEDPAAIHSPEGPDDDNDGSDDSHQMWDYKSEY